jgi:hypothetical protein
MEIRKVYIATYKYDFRFARACIGSVRYWYPDIDIVLLKDTGAGNFDTAFAEQMWKVSVLDTQGQSFGWGYSKLEPLFQQNKECFLVLDADTVMIGPVISFMKDVNTDFIVDEEVQPEKRFNEIYYNLDRINEIEPAFKYPGYSFNSGQWFGTSGKLTKEDFDLTLQWSKPPKSRHPEIVFNGDQAHLNFLLHRKVQQEDVTVARKKIMLWPAEGEADSINISSIHEKKAVYPYIIHWAGMTFKSFRQLPRYDIIRFFLDHYYTPTGKWKRLVDNWYSKYFFYEKKVKYFFKAIVP